MCDRFAGLAVRGSLRGDERGEMEREDEGGDGGGGGRKGRGEWLETGLSLAGNASRTPKYTRRGHV